MGPPQLMFSLHFAAWKHDFMLVIVHIINNSNNHALVRFSSSSKHLYVSVMCLMLKSR